MRLLLYSALLMAALLALANYRPVGLYLARVRTEVAENQRQIELVKIDQRLNLLKSKLVTLLETNPSFSRVRIALIHDSITAKGTNELQWDIVGVLAAPGHIPGDLTQNQPLNQWSDYLGALLVGNCSYIVLSDITNEAVRKRLNALSIDAFLACPVMNAKHQLLGAIFASWDDLKDVPKDINPSTQALKTTATAIGNALKSPS